MIFRALHTSLFLGAFLCSAVVFGQTGAAAQSSTSLLTIDGEVVSPLKLTAGDLAKLPSRVVRAKTHDGKEASFEGIELGEVLEAGGCEVW